MTISVGRPEWAECLQGVNTPDPGSAAGGYLVADHREFDPSAWTRIIHLREPLEMPDPREGVISFVVGDPRDLEDEVAWLLDALGERGAVMTRLTYPGAQRLTELSNQIDTGLIWLDESFACLDANALGREYLGLAGNERHAFQSFLDSSGEAYEQLTKRADLDSREPIEVEGQTLEGRQACLSITIQRIAGGYLASITDATSARASERSFQQLTNYDPLTGLANRGLLYEFAQRAINRARRRDRTVGLILVYLDFSALGDRAKRMDEVMSSIAERLGEELRGEDLIARWGAHEFAVVLEEIPRPEDARRVAEHLGQILRSPVIDGDGTELFVASSIGIAAFPGASDTVDGLIQSAETAMLEARKTGRNTYHFYSSTMQEEAEQRAAIEFHLRRSLAMNQFEIFYQPKVSLSREQIVGFEALMRWSDPNWAHVGPADFIPVAEDCGLIVQMGDWMMRHACQQLLDWQSRHMELAGASIAVNISARQLSTPNFAVTVERVLHETGISPRALELELTESTVMEDPDFGIAVLKEIHDLGVRLSIDDFGTGYSSLSYLQRLPIDVLKIDRCFVSDLGRTESASSIVDAILGLSSSLGLINVAEGVETPDQIRYFHGGHCDIIQGYYFSKPLSVSEVETLLNAREVPFREKFLCLGQTHRPGVQDTL